MTKLYQSPVQVELDSERLPKRFRWLGRWHRIMKTDVLDENQHWWGKLRNPLPMKYRCETYQGMVCDIYYSKEPRTWVLERVWD
jgi:hypothetical protein